MLVAEAVAAGWPIEAQFVAPGVSPVDGVATGAPPGAGVAERIAATDTPTGLFAVVAMPVRSTPACSSEPASWSSPTASATRATSARSCARPRRPASMPSCSRRAPSTRSTRRSCGRRPGAMFHVPVVAATLDRRARRRACGSSARRRTGAPRTPTPTGPAGWPSSPAARPTASPPTTPIDEWVRIEHRGRAESLNVAMAATVICFEAARARR